MSHKVMSKKLVPIEAQTPHRCALRHTSSNQEVLTDVGRP